LLRDKNAEISSFVVDRFNFSVDVRLEAGRLVSGYFQSPHLGGYSRFAEGIQSPDSLSEIFSETAAHLAARGGTGSVGDG
jgi:hypothetical protein